MSDSDGLYSRQKCDEVTTYVSTEKKPKEVSVVAKYYDLVTDFYEVGWGKCFHYAPQKKGETYDDAILNHELKLASAIKLKPGLKVLDAGCGIGGPMINIAKATGCDITGITICNYQIKKGTKNVEKADLSNRCRLIYGDFTKMHFEDNTFDAIYALETTCHAPNKTECFKEMFRVLKPGHFFGGYEWCLKPGYDENNSEHYKTIQMVEHSTQTQKTATFEEVNQALKDAGFELLEAQDVCTPGHSWSGPLRKRMRRKKIIRKITDITLFIAEKLKLAPKGSCQVSDYLEEGAEAFIKAEELDIFTPNYFFLARKPNN